MGKRKGKPVFPILILLLMVFLFPNISLAAKTDTLIETETGEIRVDDELYQFEKNIDFLNIYNSQNHLVFSSSCEDDNIVILNFGFSKVFHSFFVFKEKIDFHPGNYELSLEFENFTVPVIPHSETAFYTPILVENNDNIYVIYIFEDFSIRVYDLQQKELLHKVRSETPVIKLAVSKLDNRDIVEFYQFAAGKYRKHFFYIDDIETSQINFFPYEKDEKKETGPIQNEILLDYKKFIGFGDSITVGKIGSVEMPELGYIPRLQLLLNDQLYYGAEVINEGISATQTWEAVDRIEPVILTHLGKYLLFHYGTNDVIHDEIPISTVVFNIEYMMNKTLEYDVQPILTTLIPRHGKPREELHLARGFAISQGIKELAQSLDIPVIDLWDIFLYYPDSDGGYMSLMSDHVHPSEKGYQLMAEEWLRALLALPPPAPTGVTILNRSRNQIGVQWLENIELDVVQYLVKFGYSPSRLNRIVTTSTAYYVFIYNPIFSPFNRKIYFQVQAIDNGGNSSEFTPVQGVRFNEIGGSSQPSPPIISLPIYL
ncbi:GDSL-type esterase/lipase family protein [Acidobacteriota bacterium]